VRYLCMVFSAKHTLDALSDHEWRALAAATTMGVRPRRVSVTDGPFAETNEQIGGGSDSGDRPH
jgi:hypothetical protein